MVGQHVIHRMTTGMEDHGGFPGYYLATSLGTFYPWSALLPAALRRRLGPAQEPSRLRVPAGLGGRAPDPPGMRADEADPLLPAGLPGLRPAGGVAGRDPGRGAGPPEALAARAALARPAGGDRRRPGRRPAGGGVGPAGRDAVAVPGPGGRAGGGDLRRGRAVPARGDRAGRGRPGDDLGPDADRRGRLAPARRRAVSPLGDRRPAPGGALGEREGPARSWPRSSPRAWSTRWGVPPP